MADTQTAVSYATLAVVPIQRYASQYGPSSVIVSPTIIPFTANLNGNSFTQAELEGWVEQVGQTARNNGVFNPCVVILHDRSRPATPTYPQHPELLSSYCFGWNAILLLSCVWTKFVCRRQQSPEQ